ncbi:hypothetical protein GCM10023221_02990 [Luteimicrobium xylanilyticum]|uniref:Uncharacterized protein n=1 Tax=Luteimicrobium xylanilyticum TaxID=1133546 RepID=A0A5P9Q7Z2_9MICO|nr:hypothetical protein [Luteimicrobium xylanilyticum]QFU97406.1 hypothetical protein KDY119_00904 [Luteimicrobium xylanilyticum]
MSINESGNEPERDDDDTQRLDLVVPPGVTAAPDDLPTPDAQDGATRVLPTAAEPQGVDALWGLGAPEGAPSGTASEPAFVAPPVAPSVATPETSAPEPARGRRRPVRVGTVVWGLVVAACGVLVLAAAGGAHIDGGTVAIAILGGAGVALVLGSIITGVRRRDRT